MAATTGLKIGISLLLLGLVIAAAIYLIKKLKQAEDEKNGETLDSINVLDVTPEDVNDDLSYAITTVPIPDFVPEENTDSPLMSMLKDTQFWQDILLGLVQLESFIDAYGGMKKFYENTTAKYMNKTRDVVPKTSTKVLATIFKGETPTMLSRMRTTGNFTSTTKVAEKNKLPTNSETVNQVTETATKTANKANRLLRLALFSVEFISANLDQFLGAYSDVKDRKFFEDVRGEYLRQFKQQFEDQNEPWPILAGPLDKFTQDELVEIMTKARGEVRTMDTFIREMQIADDIKRSVGTSLPDDQILELISDAWAEFYKPLVLQHVAAKYSGKVMKFEGQEEPWITFTSKEQADTSYSWPPKKIGDNICMWIDQAPTDNPAEGYSSGFSGGYAVLFPGAFREYCESFGLGSSFDLETYQCRISGDACRLNGTDPDGNGFCKLNSTQSFFEGLLGTTVVRGLKQVFDQSQYEDCPEGSTDIGYACTTKNSDSRGRGYTQVNCEAAGWKTDGGGRCVKCPSGFPYPYQGSCYTNDDHIADNPQTVDYSCTSDVYTKQDLTNRKTGTRCYHKNVPGPSGGLNLALKDCGRCAGTDFSFKAAGDLTRCYKEYCRQSNNLAKLECVFGKENRDFKYTVRMPCQCPEGYEHKVGSCWPKWEPATKTCTGRNKPDPRVPTMCVSSVIVDAKLKWQMGSDACPPDSTKPAGSDRCYKPCPYGYIPGNTPDECVNENAFGMLFKKRKVPFAKPDFYNSPVGRMVKDLENCEDSTCVAKVAVFLSLAVNPVITGSGLQDIVNIGYDLSAYYTEKDA